jgi:hypothetical protein
MRPRKPPVSFDSTTRSLRQSLQKSRTIWCLPKKQLNMLDALWCAVWHLDGKAPWAPKIQPKPVLTVNSIQLACFRESGDAITHGRHAQTDLVGRDRVVPIKNFGTVKLTGVRSSTDP